MACPELAARRHRRTVDQLADGGGIFLPRRRAARREAVPRQPDPPVQTSRSRRRPARSGDRQAEGALRAGADRGVHTGSGAQPPAMARHAERGIGGPNRNRRGPCHPKPDDAAPDPASPGRAQRGASRRGDRHASADRGRDRPDGRGAAAAAPRRRPAVPVQRQRRGRELADRPCAQPGGFAGAPGRRAAGGRGVPASLGERDDSPDGCGPAAAAWDSTAMPTPAR